MIVATAGHVDHGKTTLIKALTGIDTTHLPEERKRGMTIDLGFASLKLPDGGFVGFIDVPGHERFVRNMLAGVTEIDMALLVVAADDGIMPQSREHLEILDLLGISAGAAVITKIDRVEAGRVEEVEQEIFDLLSATNLANSPIFRASAPAGTGISELRDHLIASAATIRRERGGAQFRLPIDRRFLVEGSGLVLTGTIASGQVTTGDQLMLMPGARSVRVRGLQSHGNNIEQCSAGERCALNIVAPDLDRDAIGRGGWLTAPGVAIASENLDVMLNASPTAKIREGLRVHFCHGAGDVPGRLVLLASKPLLLAQLVLDEPVHALARDNFILRDATGTKTLAGGLVLDPFAPRRGRRRKERLAELDALNQLDAKAALTALLPVASDGIDLARFVQSWNLTSASAEALWAQSSLVRIESRGFDAHRWESVRQAMLAMVDLWHKQQPDSPGPLANDVLRVAPNAGHMLRTVVLATLIREHKLLREGARLRRLGYDVEFNPSEKIIWGRVSPLLGPDVRPMTLHDIATSLKLEVKTVRQVLERASRAGLVIRIATGRYLHKSAYDGMVAQAETLSREAEDGLFDVARYRDRINQGRKLAIELLEHFDRIGFTRRDGDRRRVVSPNLSVIP